MFYVYTPDDHELVPFDSYQKAESFAQELAADGMFCEVLELLRSFEAQRVDLCEYNGVVPGIDCPAFV